MKLNKTESSEEQTDTRETTDGEDSAHEVKGATQEEHQRNRIRFITNLLVDNKQSLMDDVNYSREFSEVKDKTSKEKILNPAVTDSPSQNLYYNGSNMNRYNDGNVTKRITIPRSTIIKADRVRIYLDDYYSRLEGSISMENPKHLHEGVEGVYNPLQVIRNRALKKKYNEMPMKPLSMHKPPLIAILEFSRKRSKKMPWFVDVSETASDLTWRTSHWNELVDPQGNLWFGTRGCPEVEGPPNKSKITNHSDRKHHRHSHHHHHHHHSLRPHRISMSSVYGDIGLQNYKIKVDDNETKNMSADRTVDPKDRDMSYLNQIEHADQQSLPSDNERSRPNKFEIMMKKPRRSKSPNSRRRIIVSPTEKIINPVHHMRTGSTVSRSRNGRGSVGSNISGVSLSNVSTAGSGNDSQLPRNSLLNAISLHQLRSSGSGAVIDSEKEENTNQVGSLQKKSVGGSVNSPSDKHEYEHVNKQLQKYRAETRFLLSALNVVNQRRMTDDIIKKRHIQRRRNFLHDENTPAIANSALEKLKIYDEELDKALEKGNNCASSLLNDYSIRVETLISTTDRILSDINTTLTLKLKVLQENADRFGTLKMMQSQRLTKVLYGVLEFTIIIVCWTIWFAVSILKCIKLSMVLMIKLLKWVLW